MKAGHVASLGWMLAAGLSAAAIARADAVDPEPDVGSYGVGKIEVYHQNGSGTPYLDENPYRFYAYVNGTVTNAEVEAPDDSLYPLGSETEHNFGSAYFSTPAPSAGTLSEQFPSSAGYLIRFTTTTNPSGYEVPLSLEDASFPTSVPEITGGGNWVGGNYQVNVLDQDATIYFNPFSLAQEEQGFITLEIFSTDPQDFHAQTSWTGSSSTSIWIGPDQNGVPYFNPGDTYQGILSFHKYVQIDSESVPNLGEVGFSFMTTRTYFQFEAIPEPSTYVLLALGLGGMALARGRRRSA